MHWSQAQMRAAVERGPVYINPIIYAELAPGFGTRDALDRWLGDIDGLVTFGRQGLFAHDNTHHTLGMAYELVAALDDRGQLDRARWARARQSFESNVVED